MYQETHEIPRCNKPSRDGGKVFGYVIKDGLHGADMYANNKLADPVWDLFWTAAKDWLACWKPPKVSVPKGEIPGGPVHIAS